jgi:hypothetical protein
MSPEMWALVAPNVQDSILPVQPVPPPPIVMPTVCVRVAPASNTHDVNNASNKDAPDDTANPAIPFPKYVQVSNTKFNAVVAMFIPYVLFLHVTKFDTVPPKQMDENSKPVDPALL